MRPREPDRSATGVSEPAELAPSPDAGTGSHAPEWVSAPADKSTHGLDEALGFDPLDARPATGARRATEPNWVPSRRDVPLRRPNRAEARTEPSLPPAMSDRVEARLDASREVQRVGAPDAELHRPPTGDVTVTAVAAAPSRLFANATRVALILLFLAAALPTAEGPPWALLVRPAEVTLQALAALILIGAVHLLPLPERARARIGVALGFLLVTFVALTFRVALAGAAFDGQPALIALFAGPTSWPTVTALAALVLVPGALLGRSLGAPPWHRLGLGLGGLGAALGALALVPIGGLFASIEGAAFLGDRVGAFAALPLLALLLVSPFALTLGALARSAAALGFSLWGSALLPLFVLALFSARSDQWMQVLEPLKLVGFLGAATLYLAAALAASASRRR